MLFLLGTVATSIIRYAVSIHSRKKDCQMIARIISGFLVLFLGGLSLLSTVCAQTVKVGITSKTLFFMPYYVGQKKVF
jgi:fluoride ion exporter CrcB/FEX